MKVGYYGENYSSKRNIINIVQHLDYVKVHDLNKVLVYVYNKLPNRSFDTNDMRFSFNDFNLNRVDILHFFNTVSFGKTPWITTFETILPRFRSTLSSHHGRKCTYSALIQEKKIAKALEALSSASCKKLIAMSECNLSMQKEFLRHFPQYCSEIEHKLTCLHPPQEVFVNDFDSKRLVLDEEIRFMFVGSSFFRKGGMEILEAFSELRRNNGYNVKLTLISSLTIDNYATKEKEEDVQTAKVMIQNSDWIDYYRYLPNQKVLELMKASHVGLLPTYADTYGYSILEFQASGCPVISTDVRALPEINNNEIGWQIKIPKNYLGEAIYTTKEDRLEIGRAIKKGIKTAVLEIFENREIISNKANAAVKNIRNKHSPEEFSRRIAQLYHRALQ